MAYPSGSRSKLHRSFYPHCALLTLPRRTLLRLPRRRASMICHPQARTCVAQLFRRNDISHIPQVTDAATWKRSPWKSQSPSIYRSQTSKASHSRMRSAIGLDASSVGMIPCSNIAALPSPSVLIGQAMRPGLVRFPRGTLGRRRAPSRAQN